MSAPTSALVVVRFYEKHDKYLAGETAGFSYPEAKALVDGGVAVYVSPPPGLDEQGVPLEAETETEGEVKTGD